MAIDWMTCSDDVMEAHRLGYNEGYGKGYGAAEQANAHKEDHEAMSALATGKVNLFKLTSESWAAFTAELPLVPFIAGDPTTAIMAALENLAERKKERDG